MIGEGVNGAAVETLSMGERSIYDVHSIRSKSANSIAAMVHNWQGFREVDPAALQQAVDRAIHRIEHQGLAETDKRPGPRGLKVLYVRRVGGQRR